MYTKIKEQRIHRLYPHLLCFIWNAIRNLTHTDRWKWWHLKQAVD